MVSFWWRCDCQNLMRAAFGRVMLG